MYIQLKRKKRTRQFRSEIYILLICLAVCSKIISSSNITSFLFIEKSLWNALVLRITIVGCILIFLFNRRHSKMKVAIAIGLSIVVVAITEMSNNHAFAQMYFFILAFPSGTDIREIAKWESYCFIGLTVFIVLCYQLGIISGDMVIRDGIIRNSSGFTSANGFANTVLLALTTYVYYKQDKWKIKHSIVWTIIVYYAYISTNSRMSFVLELVVVSVMTLWSIKRYNKGKFIQNFAVYIFLIGMFFSVIVTVLYVRGYFMAALSELNRFFTYRISFMSKYFLDPGISLFGRVMVMVTRAQELSTGERWSGLDNSYVYILIAWGIIGAIIFIFLMVQLGKYLKQRKDMYGSLCLIILSIVGLTENYLASVAYNFAIIMIAHMISEKMEPRKECHI